MIYKTNDDKPIFFIQIMIDTNNDKILRNLNKILILTPLNCFWNKLFHVFSLVKMLIKKNGLSHKE